jgi:cellobiose phosphorylase
LKEGLKFYDRGKATVFEHLAKAMDYTLSNLSPRGLCLHRTADWNDALAGGRLGRGESMMVSNMTCWNIKELLPLLKKLSQKKLVQKYQMVYEKMKMVLNKECWDGEWYIRATDDDRTTLGSNKRKEGRIFLDAQTWSVISSVADSERGKQAMDAARDHLDTPYGPVIFLPSFTHLNSALGIISQFVPGTKENGAIFHHLVTWAVIAECLLGRGNQAFSYWQKTNFITRGKNPDLYKTEPYVYSEFVFGPESQFFGEGSFSWITGSAAWFYRACLDWILGVRPTLDGLLIDPCIPKEWKSFEVKRTFRGAVYQIKVKNPEYVSKGIKQIKVDGQKISGQILPVLKKGKCQVEVEMG